MKKDPFFFPHDYHARNDFKMVKLKIEMGDEGIGIYWQLIEMLYENSGIMRSQYECIANVMRTKCDLIISVIQNYNLFVFDENEFYSESVIKRLGIIEAKSIKAKESASIGWKKRKLECDRNANFENAMLIKEKKVKEKKVTPVYIV